MQDCGICDQGSSSACCEHVEQPELDGTVGIRTRGKHLPCLVRIAGLEVPNNVKMS